MSFRVAPTEMEANCEPQHEDEAGNRDGASTHVASVTLSSLLKRVKTCIEAGDVR
jgi:hypothetical protein